MSKEAVTTEQLHAGDKIAGPGQTVYLIKTIVSGSDSPYFTLTLEDYLGTHKVSYRKGVRHLLVEKGQIH